MSPQIWKVEKEKERENKKVGDRLGKLNENLRPTES